MRSRTRVQVELRVKIMKKKEELCSISVEERAFLKRVFPRSEASPRRESNGSPNSPRCTLVVSGCSHRHRALMSQGGKMKGEESGVRALLEEPERA